MWDLRFADLQLFARVADLGTLSAVARERDVPVSQVSRTLSRIEKSCGARLIHRSTHGLATTAEGDTFLAYCRTLLGTLDELEGEFVSKARQVSGRVRVAASPVIAQYLLLPGLHALNLRHPGLRIELQVEDRLADMARDGVDIAIRTGQPPSDAVVARRIGTLARHLYAAPAYLGEHGTPAHPDDLREHRLITNSAVANLNRWPFIVKDEPVLLAVDGYWRSDNTSITAQLTLQGLGIGRLVTMVGDPLVQRGLLVPVLSQFVDDQPTPVHAVTLTSRHRLPKIKACIEYWAETFGQQAVPVGT